MMPEAGAVIDAARRFLAGPLDGSDGTVAELEAAMAALDAKLGSAGQEPVRVEREIPWGEVVEGDEILSVKTHRWYEVTRSVKDGKGNIKINIKGAPQPITRPIGQMTKVIRGVAGEAMEILEVLWSATTRPTSTPVTADPGPMLTDKVDDDESE